MVKKYIVKIEIEVEGTALEAKQTIESTVKLMGGKVLKAEKKQDIRTDNQHRALHKYFEILEEEAKELGATMAMLVKNSHEIPITRILLKELFKMIAWAMFKKDSTTKLTKEEFSSVKEVFERTIAERAGLISPFPSIDN